MSAAPVGATSRTLAGELDRCERGLDQLEVQISEMGQGEEVVPEDLLELRDLTRLTIARIRKELEDLAWLEKMNRKLARRRRDASAEVVAADRTVLVLSRATAAEHARRS